MTANSERKPRARKSKKEAEEPQNGVEIPDSDAGESLAAPQVDELTSDPESSEFLELPVLPLRGTVVFPLTVVPLAAAQARSLRLIDHVRKHYGVAVIVVEHDMDLIMNLCERIQVLAYGERIFEGTPAEVQANPQVREVYLGHA